MEWTIWIAPLLNRRLGMVKCSHQTRTDQVIGATIVSHLAGELIGEFVTSMKYGIGLNKILGTIHAYPTYIEAGQSRCRKLEEGPRYNGR